MATLQETISGAKGPYFIDGVGTHTRTFNSIQINEADSTIAELYYADAPLTNVVSSMNLTSKALGAGMILLSAAGRDFSSIKLSAGSALLH